MKCQSYGIFIGYLDHSNSIRIALGDRLDVSSIWSVREQFRNKCEDFRKFRASQPEGDPKPEFYSPKFITCFGNVDDIVLVQVDDLSQFSHLISSETELLTYTLGLVPDFSNLTPASGETKTYFQADDFLANLETGSSLFAATHFKLNGIFQLAFGCKMQISVMELIFYRIGQILNDIRNGNPSTDLFASDSPDRFRFTILSPLSADDVSILFQADNYSLIAYIIAKLRNLTWSDITDASNRSFNPIEENRISAEGSSITFDWIQRPISGGEPLFVSTYSNFGCCLDMHADQCIESKVHGRVAVRGSADVSPGKMRNAMELLESGLATRKIEEPIPENSETTEYFLTGKHDLAFTLSQINGTSCLNLNCATIPTRHFLNHYSALFQTATGDIHRDRRDSGLQDIVSELVIPYPSLRKSESKTNGILAVELQKVAERLKGRFSKIDSYLGLSAVQVSLGISVSALASLKRLIAEYLVALQNPLCFDLVVDLADVVEAMYILVTESFPTAIKERNTWRLGHASETSRKRQELFNAMNSLRDCFYLRIDSVSNKRDERNQHVELKGRLSSIVSATDAPLKCALALLRYRMFPEQNVEQNDFRKKVTGLLAGSINRGADANLIHLPKERSALLAVNMDFAHLFEFEHLCRIFHEVGHALLYDPSSYGIHDANEYRARDFARQAGLASAIKEIRLIRDSGADRNAWVSEVYAEYFVYRTIFVDVTASEYLHIYLSAYAPEIDVLQPFNLADRIFRAFVVTLPPGSTPPKDLMGQFHSFFRSGVEAKVCGGSLTNFDWALIESRASSYLSLASTFWTYHRPSVDSLLNSYFGNATLSRTGVREVIRQSIDGNIPWSDFSYQKLADEVVVAAEVLRMYSVEVRGIQSADLSVQEKFARTVFLIRQLWHISTRQRYRRLLRLTQNTQLVGDAA